MNNNNYIGECLLFKMQRFLITRSLFNRHCNPLIKIYLDDADTDYFKKYADSVCLIDSGQVLGSGNVSQFVLQLLT